jgi:hypothetical protein
MKKIFILLTSVYITGLLIAMVINLGYAQIVYDCIMFIVYVLLGLILMAILSALFRALFFEN